MGNRLKFVSSGVVPLSYPNIAEMTKKMSLRSTFFVRFSIAKKPRSGLPEEGV